LISLSRACALNPDHAGAAANYGAALTESAQLAEAVERLRHAVALDPTLSQAALNLGYAFMRSGRHAEAREAFMRVLALRPNHALAWIGPGSSKRKWVVSTPP
jgi:protein O-GlcNAc transferase